MPAIQHDTSVRPSPLEILIDAIKWAIDRSLIVVTTRAIRSEPIHPGVEFTSDNDINPWRQHPKAKAVTPIGAAILRTQPGVDDLDLAASAALDVGVPYCRGIADGLNREPSPQEVDRTTRQLYLQGFEVGVRLREVLLRGRAS